MIQIKKTGYKSLRKLSIGERIKAINNPNVGQFLFSSLTPTQYADLFPRYYRDSLPDVGLLAVPSSASSMRQAAVSDQRVQQAVEGSDTGILGKIKQKLGLGKTALATKPGITAPPQLSPEDLMTYNAIKNQPLAADDPRTKFLSGLSEDQLKAGGLQKVKDEQTGKEYFKYSAPEATKEQVEGYMSKNYSSTKNASELQAGIVRTANNLGVNPTDLATLMSYETAGSMDPTKKGPITQWGQHRGLIQWGEPQAAKYGLNLDPSKGPVSSISDQLNAVEQYFKDNKFAKWMKDHPDATQQQIRLAMYATVNAGGPYKVNATDQYNGGAPGTVTDKVNEMFGMGRNSHYAKASSLMSGSYQQGTPGEYTAEQFAAYKAKLEAEMAKGQITSLAQFSGSTMGTPGAPGTVGQVLKGGSFEFTQGGWIVPKNKELYSPANATQCATLGKAFNPNIGHASEWKVPDNPGLIRPGVVVATSMYNKGGSKEHAGYHTGVALTQPNENGEFYILDQSSGHGPAVHKMNVKNYTYHDRPDIQGNYWGAVNGNSAQSLDALKIALTKTSDETLIKQLQANISTIESQAKEGKANLAEANPEQVKALPGNQPPPKAKVDIVPGGVPDYMQTPGVPPSPPVQQPQSEQPMPEQPQPGAPVPQAAPEPAKKKVEAPKTQPTRYNVNQAKLIAAIKNTDEFKNTFGSSFATDSMIVEGFANDSRVKGAGVTYDPASGTMHIKDPNDPRVKKAMEGLDTKKFMTPIEEKKKEEPKKPEVPPEVKPQPQQTQAPPVTTAPAPQAAPTPAEPPKPGEPAKAKVEIKPAPVEHQATPAPTAQAAPATPQTPPPAPPKQEPPKVPSKAEGGGVKVKGEVAAYPINGLRGDNSLVIDTKTQQPLFTMNPSREAMVPTPENNRANIVPTDKVNPQDVARPPVSATDQITKDLQALRSEVGSAFEKLTTGEPENKASPKGAPQHRDPDMIGTLLERTKVPYSNPTAMRAFSRARFNETGDATSDFHHSTGNSNTV